MSTVKIKNFSDIDVVNVDMSQDVFQLPDGTVSVSVTISAITAGLLEQSWKPWSSRINIIACSAIIV